MEMREEKEDPEDLIRHPAFYFVVVPFSSFVSLIILIPLLVPSILGYFVTIFFWMEAVVVPVAGLLFAFL